MALLCFLCATLPSRAAHADARPAAARDDEAARRAFEAGREAYDAGEFAKARAHFEQAYALSARPQLLYNIGRAADFDGDAPAAVAAYERYLASVPNAENAAFVQARVAKLRASAAGAEPPPAPTSPAATGPLAVRLEPAHQALQPEGAPSAAAPRSDKRGWYRSPWLWTAVGVVVVGAAVGTALALRGGSEELADGYGGSAGKILLGPREDK